MKGDTYKHVIIINNGNRGNTFRNNVEPNLNSSFNKLIKFSEPFAAILVRDETLFYLQ